MRMSSALGAAVFFATFGSMFASAHAASAVQKECSEKYQAAKSANTLNGMSYNQYYSQCAAAAKAAPTPAATTATPAAPTTTAAPETKAELKAEKKAEKAKEKAEKKEEKEREKAAKKGEPAPTPMATPAATAPAPAPAAPAPAPTTATRAAPAAPVASGNAVFPSAISATFSKETAGKARMHTCLAQYNANKANNGNGGLKWIEKGGGYYSECNKRLKG